MKLYRLKHFKTSESNVLIFFTGKFEFFFSNSKYQNDFCGFQRAFHLSFSKPTKHIIN